MVLNHLKTLLKFLKLLKTPVTFGLMENGNFL